ncbi:MAG: hypothetical protein ACNS61_06570, partial [Candidatus Wenzhouxiangella sp. M2_3B_020]
LMICTVVGLLPPIMVRLFNFYVPGLIISGPDTLYRFGPALQLSIAVTAVLGVVLAIRYRRHGWPWWLVSGFVVLLYALYATVGQTTHWTGVVAEIAAWSPVAVFAFGALLGALACWLGWRHGKTEHERPLGNRRAARPTE